MISRKIFVYLHSTILRNEFLECFSACPVGEGTLRKLPASYIIKALALGVVVQTFGKHFLLDLKDCSDGVLDDLEFLKEALVSVTRQSDEVTLGESFYHFTPQGVSGLVLASGSHICIHTWPEFGYAAVDIFTHSDSFRPEEAAKRIIEKLGSQDPSIVELKRGA